MELLFISMNVVYIMGCRGAFEIKKYDRSIFFYTHWRGNELIQIYLQAIKIDDTDNYGHFASTLFRVMTDRDYPLNKWYGIYFNTPDFEYPIFCVDFDTKQVCLKHFDKILTKPVGYHDVDKILTWMKYYTDPEEYYALLRKIDAKNTESN